MRGRWQIGCLPIQFPRLSSESTHLPWVRGYPFRRQLRLSPVVWHPSDPFENYKSEAAWDATGLPGSINDVVDCRPRPRLALVRYFRAWKARWSASARVATFRWCPFPVIYEVRARTGLGEGRMAQTSKSTESRPRRHLQKIRHRPRANGISREELTKNYPKIPGSRKPGSLGTDSSSWRQALSDQ